MNKKKLKPTRKLIFKQGGSIALDGKSYLVKESYKNSQVVEVVLEELSAEEAVAHQELQDLVSQAKDVIEKHSKLASKLGVPSVQLRDESWYSSNC